MSDAVDTQGLETRPFRHDPLVLILLVGHPLALASAPTFAETLHHPYVGLATHRALAAYLEEQALHLGLRMQMRIRAEGFDGVIRMVARGAGLAVVPQAAVERWAQPRPFHCVALEEGWAQRKLLLCARDFQQLPAYAKTLLETLSPL